MPLGQDARGVLAAPYELLDQGHIGQVQGQVFLPDSLPGVLPPGTTHYAQFLFRERPLLPTLMGRVPATHDPPGLVVAGHRHDRPAVDEADPILWKESLGHGVALQVNGCKPHRRRSARLLTRAAGPQPR